MSENLEKTAPQDMNTINIDKETELNFWAEQLQVSKEAIKAAVEKVGPSVGMVCRVLHT